MNSIKYGDVINIDLNPVKGSETGKVRPCVIISHNAINRNAPVVIVAVITEWNDKKKKIPFCVELTSQIDNLYKKSVIDCGQIRTVSKERFGSNIIGTLNTLDIANLKKALQLALNIN